MSKEKRRVPKLRFPGFTEDWEQRKANYIFNSVTDKGYPELPVLSASQELGMVYRDQNGIDIQHDKKNETSYKRVLPGQFVIHLRSFQGGFAYSEVEGITSPAYTVMSFKNSSEQYGLFWKHVFKSETFIKRLETITYGIRDGRSISFSDFKSLILQYPSFSEQKLIGGSIEIIESGITLHQRKLDNLKLKKKALLQKLFPKNGERYPELRFPGFTDAWEQRKLDDIAKIKTGGGTPKTANPEYWSGNIPWIQSSDLVEGDIVHVNINKFINNNALKNSAAKLISRNSIALVTRVGVGKVAVINQDFTTSQDFLSLSEFDGSDIKFLAYQLYRLMQENAKVLQGTSIKGITKTELIEQNISIPSSGQEQNLISDILSKIDSIITLHQRKLEHLKLQKKALLQQMFV